MYNQKDKYKRNKDILSSKYRSNEKPKLTNPNSDIMLCKMKEQSFARLFEELDSDQDNLISRYCVNTNEIDKTMKNIINPIITELKQENETLNKEEFIKTMCHMYEMLNMEDRNYLISYYRNKKGKTELHTRPDKHH